MRATSWTGSERQRRDYHEAPPSPYKGDRVKSNADLGPTEYVIPAGTVIGVMASGDEDWRPYLTRKTVAVRQRTITGQYAYLKAYGWRIRILADSLRERKARR